MELKLTNIPENVEELKSRVYNLFVNKTIKNAIVYTKNNDKLLELCIAYFPEIREIFNIPEESKDQLEILIKNSGVDYVYNIISKKSTPTDPKLEEYDLQIKSHNNRIKSLQEALKNVGSADKSIKTKYERAAINQRRASINKEIEKYYRKIEILDNKKEAIKYSHPELKKIFRKLGINSTKASSTAIRGYNTYSSGYDLSSHDKSLISFLGIGHDTFNTIIDTVKYYGFDIYDIQPPEKSIVGSSISSFKIKNK